MKISIAFKKWIFLAMTFTLANPSWGADGPGLFGDFVKKGSAVLSGGTPDDAIKKIAFGMFVGNALKPKEFREEPISEDAISVTSRLTFKFDILGEVKAVKRVSKDRNERRKMPAILLLTSAGTGVEAVQMMAPPKNSMVVALDYEVPANATGVRERALYLVTQIPKLQGAIVSMLFWLAKHAENVDSKRISTVNIGFGAYLAPLSLRVAEALSFSTAGTVFIHGGVQVKNFLIRYFQDNPRVRPGEKVQEHIYKILDFIDPRQHLKHLNGPFYVIQPEHDRYIPKASSQALAQGLPDPKKVLDETQARELVVERDAVMAQALSGTKLWLLDNDAIRE